MDEEFLDRITLRNGDNNSNKEYQIRDSDARKNITEAVDQLQTRISNIVANSSDTGENSELIDIRLGFDNTTYPTAGDAVRGQVQQVIDQFSTRLTQCESSIETVLNEFQLELRNSDIFDEIDRAMPRKIYDSLDMNEVSHEAYMNASNQNTLCDALSEADAYNAADQSIGDIYNTLNTDEIITAVSSVINPSDAYISDSEIDTEVYEAINEGVVSAIDSRDIESEVYESTGLGNVEYLSASDIENVVNGALGD